MTERLAQDSAGTEVPAGGQNAAETAVASVWSGLRAARETRGWSIPEVAQYLKLTARQVNAMEEGAIEQLPGLAFARGFVRNYARLLELDPAPYLNALDPVQTAAPSLEGPTENLGRMPGGGGGAIGRYPALPAAAITLVLLVLAVAGWYFSWFEPRDEASLAEVVAQSDARATPEPVSAPVAVDASVPVVQPAALPAAVAAQVAAQSAPPAVAPTAPAAAPVAAGQQRVVLDFAGQSWVEVRDGEGKVIFSRLNEAGTQQDIQGAKPLSVVVGNADQVRVSVDGKAFDMKQFVKAGGTVARFKLP
ncbi:MAG: DUF4115 domain-containing protein [Rhodocyclaceae bacterium]